jgi:hypothetical protein
LYRAGRGAGVGKRYFLISNLEKKKQTNKQEHELELRYSSSRTGFFFCLLPFSNYQTGDHPQEELAKFGYRPDVKEEFFLRILSYFGYLLEPVVQIWWVIFSPFCKIW